MHTIMTTPASVPDSGAINKVEVLAASLDGTVQNILTGVSATVLTLTYKRAVAVPADANPWGIEWVVNSLDAAADLADDEMREETIVLGETMTVYFSEHFPLTTLDIKAVADASAAGDNRLYVTYK